MPKSIPDEIADCLSDKKCDPRKKIAELSEGKWKSTPPPFTRQLLGIIKEVHEDVPVPAPICDFLDDQFDKEQQKPTGNADELDEFLRENCFKELYHGTTKEHLFESKGVLCPRRGEFVEDAYGEDARVIPKYVYATDYKHLGSAISAIQHRRKDDADHFFTRDHGALVKLGAESFRRAQPYREFLEENDYVSEECVPIEGVITGHQLASVLKKEVLPKDAQWKPYEEWRKDEEATRKNRKITEFAK